MTFAEKEEIDSIASFIAANYSNFISEWYYYFNHDGDFKNTFPFVNDEAINRLGTSLETLISGGKNAKANSEAEIVLCKIAYKVSQLMTMKGIILGFRSKDRKNNGSISLFFQAKQFAERSLRDDYRNQFIPFQLSFLCNELNNKHDAVRALQNIKPGNESYGRKTYYLNEIMYDLCADDKLAYRQLMFDPDTKQIAGLSRKDTGLIQQKAQYFFALKKEERSQNVITSIKDEIDTYARERGFSWENAHDVICRNIYTNQNQLSIELKRTRSLFWKLYAEETIPLYLKNQLEAANWDKQ